jgi:hypothetical protein
LPRTLSGELNGYGPPSTHASPALIVKQLPARRHPSAPRHDHPVRVVAGRPAGASTRPRRVCRRRHTRVAKPHLAEPERGPHGRTWYAYAVRLGLLVKRTGASPARTAAPARGRCRSAICPGFSLATPVRRAWRLVGSPSPTCMGSVGLSAARSQQRLALLPRPAGALVWSWVIDPLLLTRWRAANRNPWHLEEGIHKPRSRVLSCQKSCGA